MTGAMPRGAPSPRKRWSVEAGLDAGAGTWPRRSMKHIDGPLVRLWLARLGPDLLDQLFRLGIGVGTGFLDLDVAGYILGCVFVKGLKEQLRRHLDVADDHLRLVLGHALDDGVDDLADLLELLSLAGNGQGGRTEVGRDHRGPLAIHGVEDGLGLVRNIPRIAVRHVNHHDIEGTVRADLGGIHRLDHLVDLLEAGGRRGHEQRIAEFIGAGLYALLAADAGAHLLDGLGGVGRAGIRERIGLHGHTAFGSGGFEVLGHGGDLGHVVPGTGQNDRVAVPQRGDMDAGHSGTRFAARTAEALLKGLGDVIGLGVGQRDHAVVAVRFVGRLIVELLDELLGRGSGAIPARRRRSGWCADRWIPGARGRRADGSPSACS